MTPYEKTLGPGWRISQQGYTDLSQNGLITDPRVLYQNALDSDLKDIGTQILSSEVTKSKIGELVLQIHKIRNVAAPKANEDSQVAPRMLKLTLTDGYSFCQGIEVENIPQLSTDRIPPGSKILLKNADIRSGYILLHPSCCTYLGGKVPTLYEKWEISRSLLKNARRRSSNPDGPPPWVNFGTKVSSADDSSFKSLSSKEKAETKQNSEFDAQRKGAIAEAESGAAKKVFGGGGMKKLTNNQVPEFKKPFNSRERVSRGDKRRNDPKEKISDTAQTKPPEKVSLFHFLEDKLSGNETHSVATADFEVNNVKTAANYSNGNANRGTQHKSEQQEFNNKKQNAAINYNYNQQQYNSSTHFENKYTNSSRNNRPDVGSSSSRVAGAASNHSVDAITNNVGKMSLNSQFASRSLKQHLNLNKTKNDDTNAAKNSNWKIGDSCLAKYWEDGKFYNATITDITDNTLVVLFTDYGNMEEVLKSDCKQGQYVHKPPYRQNQRYYTRKFAGKPDQKKYSDKSA